MSAPVSTDARPPLAAIYAITLTGILANTILNPAIPDILDGLGASRDQAGLLVGSGALPGVFMAPVIGVLADRYGRRQVLLPCLVSFGALGLLGVAAPTFEVLLALRVAQGAASAGLINLAVVIIGDHWEGLERARAIGRNAAVLTFALAAFPFLGGVLTQLFGWRAVFVPFVFGFVTAVVVVRVLPPGRPPGVEPRTVGRQLSEAWVVLRRPAVLAATFLGFEVFFLIFGAFLTVVPLHLDADFGLDAFARGVVLAVPAAFSTIVALNLGRLRARFGGRHLVLVGSAVYAVGFTAMGLSPTVGPFVAAAAFYGLAEGMTVPTLQDFAAGAGPASSRGSVVAVWVAVVRAGQFVGPLAAGVALDLVGTSTTLLLAGSVAAATVATQLVAGRRVAAAG